MGSTGDRAASLTIEGCKAYTGRRTVLIVTEHPRAPVNSSVDSFLRHGVPPTALGAGVCAPDSINLPTDAYETAFLDMRIEPQLFVGLGD